MKGKVCIINENRCVLATLLCPQVNCPKNPLQSGGTHEPEKDTIFNSFSQIKSWLFMKWHLLIYIYIDVTESYNIENINDIINSELI